MKSFATSMLPWLLSLKDTPWKSEDFLALDHAPKAKVSKTSARSFASSASVDSKSPSKSSQSSQPSQPSQSSQSSQPSRPSRPSQSSCAASNASSLSVKSPVFVKQFNQDQLELWARLRTTPSRYQDNTCTFNDVYCVDGTIIKGDIDLLEPDRGASRRFCTWANVNWALDTFGKSLRCNEFYHEALLSYAVRTELHDLPMFSRAELMEVNARRRTLTFKNVGGHDFDTLIHRMSASELHSTIAQVLVGIRMAQHRLSLKHHDLHLGNVMVSPRTEQASMILDTPEGMLRIPLVGYDATIIDFGLSSISKNDEALIRLDIDLLIMGNSASSSQKSVLPQDLGKSWGTWEPELKNDTGYDFAMFVESVTDTVVRERPLNLDKIKLLVKLGELISTPFTDRNRPENPSLVDWGKVWVALELNP